MGTTVNLDIRTQEKLRTAVTRIIKSTPLKQPIKNFTKTTKNMKTKNTRYPKQQVITNIRIP